MKKLSREKLIRKLKEMCRTNKTGYVNMYHSSLCQEEIDYIIKKKYDLINECDFIQDIYDGYAGTGFVIWWNK